MDIADMLYPFDFAEIVTKKFEKVEKINKGSVVVIAGSKAFPISEKDPYNQRIKFIVQTFDDKLAKFTIDKSYLMDPRSLKKIGGERQKFLQGIFNNQFETKDTEEKV